MLLLLLLLFILLLILLLMLTALPAIWTLLGTRPPKEPRPSLLAPLLPGPAQIEVQTLRQGSRMDFLQTTVRQAEAVMATATLALGGARPSAPAAIVPPAPELPPWTDLPEDLPHAFDLYLDALLALREKPSVRGAALAGLEYSGSIDSATTEMYWPQTHMVAPKEQALQCKACHCEDGCIDWEMLGYPGDPIKWGSRVRVRAGDARSARAGAGR